MREIKFRAWIGDRYELSVVAGDGGFYHNTKAECTTRYSADVPIEQAIGFKDSNGIDLYEGDIVRCASKDFPDQAGDKIVVWAAGEDAWAFADNLEAGHGLHPRWGGWSSVKRIGNVHEDPNLIPL